MNLEHTKYNSMFRYEKIPGWSGYYRNPQLFHEEYLTKLKFNSLGMNNEEINFNTLHNNYVVLAIGDSFVFGFGVPLNESFPKVAERHLKDKKVSVLNAGTGSYALDSYLNYIKYRSDKFSPNLTIVAINLGNDLTNQGLYILVNGTLVDNPVSPQSAIERVKRFVNRHSEAYDFLLKLLVKTPIGDFLKEKGIFAKNTPTLDDNPANYQRYKIMSEQVIKQIKIETEKRNQKLLVILIPIREQVDDGKYVQIYNGSSKIDRYVFQKDVSAILKKYNISYIDILETYIKLNKNNSFYYDYDGHFNKKGYALLGNITANEIRKVMS